MVLELDLEQDEQLTLKLAREEFEELQEAFKAFYEESMKMAKKNHGAQEFIQKGDFGEQDLRIKDDIYGK